MPDTGSAFTLLTLLSSAFLVTPWEVGTIPVKREVLAGPHRAVESFAKDIHNKYIDPPHTTDFAIMFLPVESLYGEVLRHPGLFETLQRKYKITVTDPTTLSALLNSLQMGFRTLAVQKKSSEVWKVLEAVKTEFGKFEEQLDTVYSHLNKASNSLDVLKTTRTNVMLRKLKDVGSLNSPDKKSILETGVDEV